MSIKNSYEFIIPIGLDREEPYGSIWDRDNWIVTAQNIVAGTKADKNVYLQLDCISLDDYFSRSYVGKNITEIQSLAEADGFAVRFEDNSWHDLNDKVASMDQNAKEDWIATEARQYGGADKTAVVTIKFIGETTESTPAPTPTPKPTATPAPTSIPTVFFSTNDRDTAKEGNSGVFSYKSMGYSYDAYYVIDFDTGYVYFFSEGNENAICDRLRIESGDLNDVLIITYHDGDDFWSYGLHYKWKKQPDHLIVEDESGYESDYYATDLADALRIRDSKIIRDY